MSQSNPLSRRQLGKIAFGSLPALASVPTVLTRTAQAGSALPPFDSSKNQHRYDDELLANIRDHGE